MYVCMYDYIAVSTRTLTPPTTGDRLNSQRHVLVQAAVTTQLCHHTCHLPQGVKGQCGLPGFGCVWVSCS